MRWVLAAGVVASLGGCGRLNFDIRDDSAAQAGDASAAACKTWGAFGAPTRIPEVGAVGSDDWGPFPSADGLAMYVFSDRAGSTSGSLDIWVSTRTDPSGTLSPATLVPNVNSTTTERSPWISSDGLTLGISSGRTGGLGMQDLYWATRPDLASPFGAPVAIANVNSVDNEFFSVLSANSLRLYITSTRLGALDIFVAERATTADAFGTPAPIAELNTAQNERHLAISSDELEVFIDSNRTGAAGVDIYRATRADLTSPFSVPQPVVELNSPMDEIAPSLSADGSTLYYAYNTVTAGGADAEVWAATRPCLSTR